jgi:hypothetical protein
MKTERREKKFPTSISLSLIVSFKFLNSVVDFAVSVRALKLVLLSENLVHDLGRVFETAHEI